MIRIGLSKIICPSSVCPSIFPSIKLLATLARSEGICDGAPLTAHSNFLLLYIYICSLLYRFTMRQRSLVKYITLKSCVPMEVAVCGNNRKLVKRELKLLWQLQ